MALESTFRLAPDVSVEVTGDTLLLLIGTKAPSAVLRLPLELKAPLEALRRELISSALTSGLG